MILRSLHTDETPASRTSGSCPSQPFTVELRLWLERSGARTVVLDADEQDRIVAFTSHLSQLASTALGATLADRLKSPGECTITRSGLD